jgi:hypothetical protein
MLTPQAGPPSVAGPHRVRPHVPRPRGPACQHFVAGQGTGQNRVDSRMVLWYPQGCQAGRRLSQGGFDDSFGQSAIQETKKPRREVGVGR